MSNHNDQSLTKYRCENHLYFVRLFFCAIDKNGTILFLKGEEVNRQAGKVLKIRLPVLMSISKYSDKNSYRPHVRSEAGYDIPWKSAVRKTADGTRV